MRYTGGGGCARARRHIRTDCTAHLFDIHMSWPEAEVADCMRFESIRKEHTSSAAPTDLTQCRLLEDVFLIPCYPQNTPQLLSADGGCLAVVERNQESCSLLSDALPDGCNVLAIRAVTLGASVSSSP